MKDQLKKIISDTGLWALADRWHQRKMLKLIKEKQYRTPASFSATDYKTSNTIFVLGSGYSINKLSKEDWDHVATHDSYGFNTWMFHPFVPTYFGLETQADRDYFEVMYKEMEHRAKDYQEVQFFVQFPHFYKAGVSYSGLDVPAENWHYFAPFALHTTNHSILRNKVKKALDHHHDDFHHIIHYSGSLSYVIMMCYTMGYTNIVLLGIDLNDPRYWFMKEGLSGSAKKLEAVHMEYVAKTGRSKLNGKHATIDKKFTSRYGSLPVDEYIEILADELARRDVKLYIGNESSKLHPTLPLYNFPA
ncbi:MAG: hypothetical protein ACPF9D_08045 [Owenweeksia sp.]